MSDEQWNRYVVILADGSREECVAQKYETDYDPASNSVELNLKPSSSYSYNQQGLFINPLGIHRVGRDVGPPNSGEHTDDDEEETDE